jgi:hypothetical protein
MKASSGGTDADFPQDSPLVGATITVDHLVNVGTIIEVRNRVAELTTDSDGYFVTLTGQQSGLFRITTRGGSFRDYATGQTIVLDEADGLTALLYIDRFEDLTTGLVTPVTHLTHTLIDARTQARTRRRPRHVLRARDRARRSPLRRAALGADRPRRPHRGPDLADRRGPRRVSARGLVAPGPGHRPGRWRHGAAGQPVHAGPRSRPRPRGPTLRRQRRQRSHRQLRHPVRAVRAGAAGLSPDRRRGLHDQRLPHRLRRLRRHRAHRPGRRRHPPDQRQRRRRTQPDRPGGRRCAPLRPRDRRRLRIRSSSATPARRCSIRPRRA